MCAPVNREQCSFRLFHSCLTLGGPGGSCYPRGLAASWCWSFEGLALNKLASPAFLPYLSNAHPPHNSHKLTTQASVLMGTYSTLMDAPSQPFTQTQP